MRLSFVMLAAADLVLLSLTAILGLVVEGMTGFARHFALGLLSGLFTCFLHVVVFMYFVVQDKIMKQARVCDRLDQTYAVQTDRLKSLALRVSLCGIFAILITVGLGAAVGIAVPAEAHLIAAFAAIAVNGVVFAYQYSLLTRYAGVFAAAFPEG